MKRQYRPYMGRLRFGRSRRILGRLAPLIAVFCLILICVNSWHIIVEELSDTSNSFTESKTSFADPNTMPVQNPQPGGSKVFFDDTPTFGEGESDTSGSKAVFTRPIFTSTGVARVVLPRCSGEGPGCTTPPRILTSGTSWRKYDQYLDDQVAGGDADAERNKMEQLHDPSGTFTELVSFLEVQLLRQRSGRAEWEVQAGDSIPIVGVVPRESQVLLRPVELLVEEYSRAEDQPNETPDPQRLVPLSAMVNPTSIHVDTSMAASLWNLRQRVRTNDDTTASGGAYQRGLHPLVELQMPLSPAAAQRSASSNKDDSVLVWRASGPDEKDPYFINVHLAIKHPAFYQDPTFTDALMGTFCSRNIHRLYGLRVAYTSENDASTKDDIFAAIPLDGVNESEVVIGVPGTTHSTGTPGVVPLLYMDLMEKPGTTENDSGRRVSTVGILWLNSAPLLLSTKTTNETGTCVTLRSTAGATQVYLLPGPSPAAVLRQYYTLTGFPTLPPRALFGYHHGSMDPARNTQGAIQELSLYFYKARLPLDVVWATASAASTQDTPFTWNATAFKNPTLLQSNLWYRGRRYLTVRAIPTVPATLHSPLYMEGRRANFFVSFDLETTAGCSVISVDGKISNVIDFSNPSARRWYGSMMKYKRFVGSTNHTFFSLMYSAPFVRGSSQEILPNDPTEKKGGKNGDSLQLQSTLPMEMGHYGGVVHREVHQILSLLFAKAAYEGTLRRTNYYRRALLFTDTFFAGIQRYAVVRINSPLQPSQSDEQPSVGTAPTGVASLSSTGIITAAWAQLHIALATCATLSVLGIPFSGANLGHAMDVALALSTSATKDHRAEVEDLIAQWYQIGAMMPLMHTQEVDAPAEAFGGSNAGEGSTAVPWWNHAKLSLTTQHRISGSILLRYALLPYFYTTAFEVSYNGSFYLAPVHFTDAVQEPPRTVPTSSSNSTPVCYSVGKALLMCPKTNTRHTEVIVPGIARTGTGLYNLWTGAWHQSGSRIQLIPSTAVDNDEVESTRQLTPLWWLTAVEPTTAPIDATRPEVHPPLTGAAGPVFLRSGHIIATQNSATSLSSLSHLQPLHSSHMPANWTITVALPPLPSPETSTRVLLASGYLYWDEGSYNSGEQQQTPTGAGKRQDSDKSTHTPMRNPHCLVRMKCFYDSVTVQNGKAPRLLLHFTQESDTCGEAFAQLQSHWQEVPQGYREELLIRATQRRSQQRKLKAALDEEEDAGKHRLTKHGTAYAKLDESDSDDDGIFKPLEGEHNNLIGSNYLHRLRLLFHSATDATQLLRHTTSTPLQEYNESGESDATPLQVNPLSAKHLTITRKTTADTLSESISDAKVASQITEEVYVFCPTIATIDLSAEVLLHFSVPPSENTTVSRPATFATSSFFGINQSPDNSNTAVSAQHQISFEIPL